MYANAKFSFIIPCFRSEQTIRAVVSEIVDTFQYTVYQFEIILVDDNSPDHVWHEIKKLAGNDRRIIGVRLSKNMGQHAALMAGYRQASGDIIISLDDDGQSPVDEIPNLIEKLNEGYDVVYASYPEKKHSLFRNLGSRINDFTACILIEKPRALVLSSVFAMKRFVMDEIVRYGNPYPYVSGLVLRSTAHICNVPVRHRARQEGKSGYNLWKLLSLWLNGFTSFSVKPLRIATVTGALCAFIGFLCGVWVVIRKLCNPDILAGYSSIMALMLFLGGVIMLMLGLIGEYIGRIYICINQSPQYVIQETANLETDVLSEAGN